MVATSIVQVRAGELTLEVAPWLGGAVTAFRLGEIELLRPTPQAAIAHGQVRQTGAFALVPYSNRIAQGRFEHEGAAFQLAASPYGEAHALHGNGWQLPWTVTECSAISCVLQLDHVPVGDGPPRAAGWPFAFRATQSMALSPSGLRITLELENRDDRPMPAGLGWHPFFPLRADTTLAFSARSVWLTDAELLPTRRIPASGAWDYAQPRTIAGARLNHCFTGWDRQARIALGNGLPTLTIAASEAFPNTIVYAPADADFFAFEPVTHMPDAINRPAAEPGEGMAILQPRQRLSGEVALSVAGPAGARR